MDFSGILKDCGYETEEPQKVLNNIEKLSGKYSVSELSEIYDYFLTNVKNPLVLAGIIRLADSNRSKSTFSILLDILLTRSSIEQSDEDINLKVLCIKAITNYKDTAALPVLLSCLNNKSENYKIRLACADALGRIGDRGAVNPLIAVVKDEEEKSVYVKESAAFALGLIGDDSAIDPLLEIINTKQGLLDKFSFLKERIIEALGKFNITGAKILNTYKISLMDSSPMVRINTIEALMNGDYEEAPMLIRKALHDDDEEVQRNALIALYNMLGCDILDEVISLPGYSDFIKQEAKNIKEEYENGEE